MWPSPPWMELVTAAAHSLFCSQVRPLHLLSIWRQRNVDLLHYHVIQINIFLLSFSAPCAPTNILTALPCTTQNYGVVSVSWGQTNGAQSYVAEAVSADGHSSSCNSSTTSCDLQGLHCGQIYNVSVYSLAGGCQSAKSAVSQVQTGMIEGFTLSEMTNLNAFYFLKCNIFSLLSQLRAPLKTFLPKCSAHWGPCRWAGARWWMPTSSGWSWRPKALEWFLHATAQARSAPSATWPAVKDLTSAWWPWEGAVRVKPAAVSLPRVRNQHKNTRSLGMQGQMAVFFVRITVYLFHQAIMSTFFVEIKTLIFPKMLFT